MQRLREPGHLGSTNPWRLGIDDPQRCSVVLIFPSAREAAWFRAFVGGLDDRCAVIEHTGEMRRVRSRAGRAVAQPPEPDAHNPGDDRHTAATPERRRTTTSSSITPEASPVPDLARALKSLASRLSQEAGALLPALSETSSGAVKMLVSLAKEVSTRS